MEDAMQIRRLCLWLTMGVLIAASPASAQTSAPASPGPNSIPKPADNLSEKLNRSNGVVQPKEVDPGIEKPAPRAGDPNVIAPPGAAPGTPAPQPK
jgi:hypothetical protein